MTSRALAALLIVAATTVGSCSGERDSDQARGPSVPAPSSAANPAKVTVPDVVGMRFGAAVRTIEHARLTQRAPAFPGTLGNPAYGTKCVTVDSEAPKPGTRVERGTTVAIVYGACKKSISKGG